MIGGRAHCSWPRCRRVVAHNRSRLKMTQNDQAQDESSYPKVCAIRPAFAMSGLTVVLPTEGKADESNNKEGK
jgi:hypothetical protein